MVELLLTVVFVSLGSLMIQGTLLKGADVFGRYSNTLRAIAWSEQKWAASREALLRDELASSEEGSLSLPGKDFQWSLGSDELETDLYSIRLSLRWTESGKPLAYEKESYVYKRDLSLQL